MESNSDLSSYSSRHIEQKDAIPSIHVQQFLLQQHARNLSSIHSEGRQKNYPHIFTVAQTLKDPLILNHIKPDYGSLGEFIGDINIGRDLLNQKKRKNELNEQQIQQRKLKSSYKQKNQQELNNIYLNKQSSSIMKKVAAKLLVQNLFKDSFGVTLNTFENQNIKTENSKNYKINLDRIQQIFCGKQLSNKKMQEVNDKKTVRPGAQNIEEQKLQKSKKRQIKNWTQKEKIQLILQIKSKYPSLKHLQIKKQCLQYKRLVCKQQDQQLKVQSKRSTKISTGINEPTNSSGCLQISQKQLIIQKLWVKSQLILYIVSQLEIQKIQTVMLSQVRISEQQLCFLIQVIKNLCEKLNKLVIRCLSLERTQNLAVKIKELLEVSTLKQMALQYMDIQTKQFCVICLGIGSNITLTNVSFDNNNIDERACKSLQLITKHCLNLKKISMQKNYLQPYHFRYFSAESKSKLMI